jgi:hypothetical protein
LPDENGKRLVGAPSGSVDFGFILREHAELIGIQSGPIRLQEGYPGSKGFGRLHIEGYPDRVAQFTNLGFTGLLDYVHFVATGYEWIGLANDQRYAVVRRKLGHDLALILQWHQTDCFWGVVTALPYRVARFKKAFEVTRTGGSEPTPDTAVKHHRFATLSLPRKASNSDNGPER